MSLVTFDWTVTFGQLITFLTLLAGFIYTWMREGRARRWAQEDAERKNRHLTEQDEAIREGNSVAKEAFSEANAINAKILDLQGQLKNIAQRKGDPENRTPDDFSRKTDQTKP